MELWDVHQPRKSKRDKPPYGQRLCSIGEHASFFKLRSHVRWVSALAMVSRLPDDFCRLTGGLSQC